ncbi:PPOX class F420-dependent oxidoreductase [uncultured Friedmanniella sp.]|uniref:PPOX class F420-dependent oxidoreductase n=1 Tax=uncultured Friedmanniella sp. TaxID=335381 RepID=UPI0035CC6E26
MPTEPTPEALTVFEREPFMSLTTFRRNGEGVPTPVWVVRDGDALLVTTVDGTGKVRRLRRDDRVELVPCSRGGKVAPDAPRFTGRAEVLTEPSDVQHVRDLLAPKYGLQFRLVTLLERLPRKNPRARVGLRVTPDATQNA